MRRPFIAGNWKMHGTRAENAELIEGLLVGLPGQPMADIAVCPPFVYLWEIARLLKSSSVAPCSARSARSSATPMAEPHV